MAPHASLAKASEFIWYHARLLERRVFAYHFLDDDARHVVDTLRAYQNRDGGFGHALEPDLRGPDSQPVFVDFALTTLREVGARDAEIGRRVCDFLASIATPSGAVPAILATAQQQPRAAHWNGDAALQPSLNFTSGIAGQLHWQGIQHPWLDRATDYCWAELCNSVIGDAHSLRSAFVFLDNFGGERRTRKLTEKLAAQLPAADFFLAHVPVARYGLTPLHFAPSPRSPERRLFSDSQIEAHLDDLAARQASDGGWPIFWDAPGETARNEWRARWTLDALSALRAYGRL